MIIKIQDKCEPKSSEITPHCDFIKRRIFIQQSLTNLLKIVTPVLFSSASPASLVHAAGLLSNMKKSQFSTQEELNSYFEITHYNNFYEFSTDKKQVADLAQNFSTNPWKVEISGEVHKPGILHLDDILKNQTLEERIYRFRCVEAWSMVIPWNGFSLAKLIKQFEPTSKAKYVQFTTLFNPEQMPGQKRNVLSWPYTEGLRMDEAMHPLTILATGIYGEHLPSQNGAPLRLVIPWKYGFKSIKSIVKIHFTQNQPNTTWNLLAPKEYGFYANVNPDVDHPRWSQRRERRIGNFFKQNTSLFNGYADHVAQLYSGMDLTINL